MEIGDVCRKKEGLENIDDYWSDGDNNSTAL